MGERSFTAIVTKLYPPVVLNATVTRQRILRQLKAQPLRKITLIQSPAGFGKTTLLAQWRKELPYATCWLSLDRDDIEPARFIKYLIKALQSTELIVGDEANRCLEGGGRLATHDVVGCLINEIVELQDHLVLFLDDYHLVDRPEISAIIQDLINFSPPNFHLVVSSRTVPSFPVANLRAQDILTEITEIQMRFDQNETIGFFVDLRGLDLAESEILALHGKTEGWIAGLQLATLSLSDPNRRQSFIENFSGNIRDIADYLADEVLNQLDERTQSFLLKTAILERINAGVANKILGQIDSQLVLEKLEASNLFLVPLDNIRKWYRYHHLFRQFLLSRLRRDSGSAISQLYLAASKWFMEEGYTEEAINYALEADDDEYAAGLVENHAIRLIYDGRMPQVERWIRKIPDEIYTRRIRLPIYHCWALVHMGLWQQADKVIDDTEKRLKLDQQSKALSSREVELLKAEIDVLKLANAVVSDNMEVATSLVINPFPDEQVFSYFSGTQANALGFISFAKSDLSEAVAWGQKALVRHRQSGSVYGQVYAHCLMGLSLITQGDLHEALELMDRAEQLVIIELCNHSFSVAMVSVIKGAILYEWNQLDKSRELLSDSLPLVEECAYLEIRNLAFITLARIEQASGNFNNALEFQHRAIGVSRESLIARTRARLSYEQVRLLLRKGDIDSAMDEAKKLGVCMGNALPELEVWDQITFFYHLIYCRLMVAEGKGKEILDVLANLQKLSRKAARKMMALEVGMITAQAHFQVGDKNKSYASALEVLEASQREGYMRLFLDEGNQGEALLHSLYTHLNEKPQECSKLVRDYLHKILLGLNSSSSSDKPQFSDTLIGGKLFSVTGLVEELSNRETKVLSEMSKGFSNKQIAKHLSVSVNTIRWHVSNILAKFEAQNRTEAVAKAQELRIIQ